MGKRLSLWISKRIIGFYEFMRSLGRRGAWFTVKVDRLTSFSLAGKRKRIRRNYGWNLASFEGHRKTIEDAGGFIENQHVMQDMRYGLATVAYSGCEIIALFNILNYLRRKGVINIHRSFASLLSTFEKDGAALAGEFGTSPKALYDFLAALDIPGVKESRKEQEFEALFNGAQAVIISFMNNGENIRDMVHTVAVTRNEDGGFCPHNAGTSGRSYRDYASLMRDMGRGEGRAKTIYMIAVT